MGTTDTINKINVAWSRGERIAAAVGNNNTTFKAGTTCFTVAAPVSNHGVWHLVARILSLARSRPDRSCINSLACLVALTRIIINNSNYIFAGPDTMTGSIANCGSCILAGANISTAVISNRPFGAHARQCRTVGIVSARP